MYVTKAVISNDNPLRRLLLLGQIRQVQILGTDFPLFRLGGASRSNNMVQPRCDKRDLWLGT